MNENNLAYIDENGSFGFDFEKEGTDSHFIVTAVILKKENKTSIENILKLIIKKFNSIRSNTIASNDDKRINILKDLSVLDFNIIAIIIDKKQIYNDSGLVYKPTFYKFLNNLLHNELYRVYKKLEIVSDKIGSNDFMNSFKKYVHKRHPTDLFKQFEFGFTEDKSEPLLMLVDFISGTIGRGFQERYKSNRFEEMIPSIKDKLILKLWPENFESYIYDTDSVKNEFDLMISQHALKLANEFINNNIKLSDRKIKLKTGFLKFLLLYYQFIDSEKYISTGEIIRNLRNTHEDILSTNFIRTEIVAKLRDAGIIIVSSRNGYKIPSSINNIYDFVNHDNSLIVPIMSRLKKCRDEILAVTNMKLDILEKTEYSNLKKYFDSNTI